jgi:hypothetical protein
MADGRVSPRVREMGSWKVEGGRWKEEDGHLPYGTATYRMPDIDIDAAGVGVAS